ncbi:MAG TPA: pyridoxamine 5'-phosphate oxidase family protein [Micromonospora sp.]
MGKVYTGIDERLRQFISAQRMFFVATAPSGADGHVNVSPKGMTGTFVILGEHRVAYLDYHGSGAETIAHLRDNGRITIMFCAFDGPPKILRLYGHGVAVPVGHPDHAARLADFPDPPDLHAVRAVITVEVTRVADSCGYAVPLMTWQEDRDLLIQAHSRRSTEDLVDYRATRNGASIDGLPVFS